MLAGRTAEMIERVYGTEGGEMLWIYRYDGQGRLIRYYHDQTAGGDGRTVDAWGRSEGAMILGITPSPGTSTRGSAIRSPELSPPPQLGSSLSSTPLTHASVGPARAARPPTIRRA